MAIAKEDLEVGGRCFHVERQGGPGGVAVQQKLVSVEVVKIEKKFALVRTEAGHKRYVPFSQLQRDDGWARDREKRESEKRARIAREARVLEPSPLKFTLAEKFANEDRMPAKSDVTSEARADALKQIEALKQAAAPPPAMPPPASNSRNRRLTAAEKNAATDTWLEALKAGMSTKEAQQLAGVHESSLRKWVMMRERGIPIVDSSPPGRVPGSKSRSVAEKRAAVVAALTEHDTIVAASLVVGVEVSQLQAYLRQLRNGELGPISPALAEALARRKSGYIERLPKELFEPPVVDAATEPEPAPEPEPAAPPAPPPAAPPAPPAPPPPVRLVPPPALTPREKELAQEVRHLRAELAHLHEAPPQVDDARADALERELRDVKAENERLRARIAKLLTLIAED